MNVDYNILKCIPVLIHVIIRPPHYKQSWKNVNKHSSYPWCHRVSLRSTKMNVEYNHGNTYTEIPKNWRLVWMLQFEKGIFDTLHINIFTPTKRICKNIIEFYSYICFCNTFFMTLFFLHDLIFLLMNIHLFY